MGHVKRLFSHHLLRCVPVQILKNNTVQHDATAREWTAKYAM
jgi:hypothetical protein